MTISLKSNEMFKEKHDFRGCGIFEFSKILIFGLLTIVSYTMTKFSEIDSKTQIDSIQRIKRTSMLMPETNILVSKRTWDRKYKRRGQHQIENASTDYYRTWKNTNAEKQPQMGTSGGGRGRALVGEGIVVERGALEIGRSFFISPTRGESNSDKPTRGGNEYSKPRT